MRPTRHADTTTAAHRTPGTLGETVVASAIFLGLLALALLVASAPGPVLATLALVAAGLAGRRALRRLAARRRTGRARRVCLPVVDVCVTA